MHIADSKLFQEFSGQFLRDMYGRGPLSALSESLSGGMDGVVQYLMNRSSLEVIAVNIRNATKDSFSISIECRVTGTGPISSTVAPMMVDLIFNSSRFGHMRLPEIHTSVWGTTVLIMEQEVAVTDMTIYQAYVRSIITADETSFRLDNGKCNITALGLSAGCTYGMEVPMTGMDGLRAELDSVVRAGDGDGEITVGLSFRNPSPVQIDHGETNFELRTVEGLVVAHLSGSLQILRGTFTVRLQGSLGEDEARTDSTKLRLVGTGTNDGSWCNETIQYIDTMMETGEGHRKALGLRM